MSKGQIAVVAIAAVGVLGLLGYEIYALASKNPDTHTISAYVWEAAYKYPLVPLLIGFVIGLLFGHFFWQRA